MCLGSAQRILPRAFRNLLKLGSRNELSLAREGADHRVCIDRLTIEQVKRCLNIVFLDNFAQLAHDERVFVRLVARVVAVFTAWIVPIVDAHLVFAHARLQNFPLILLVEVHDEERMLEPDEEVPLIGRFFGLLLIGNWINRVVATLVLLVDLLFELLLGVAAGDVFDA